MARKEILIGRPFDERDVLLNKAFRGAIRTPILHHEPGNGAAAHAQGPGRCALAHRPVLDQEPDPGPFTVHGRRLAQTLALAPWLHRNCIRKDVFIQEVTVSLLVGTSTDPARFRERH